jgi:hypothetical protein
MEKVGISIPWPLGIYYGHLVFWWQFGIFSTVLVYCVKKNMSTLHGTLTRDKSYVF